METKKHIDDLFSYARTQTPKTSFEDTAKAFQVGIAAAAGGGILTKWTALSLKFKTIIMCTTISIISVTGIFIGSLLTSEKSVAHSEISSSKMRATELQSESRERKNAQEETTSVTNQSADAHSLATVEKQPKMAKLPNLEQLGLTMLPKQISAFSQPLGAPIKRQMSTNNVTAVDSTRMKLFEITEKTTNQEIENIRQQALDAGLEFTFSTKIRQHKIKKLDLHMKKGNQKWMSKISGTDAFSFTFGWWEDEAGQFERYICDDDLARICGDCD